MLEKPELMKDFNHDEKGGFYQIDLLNIYVYPQFHQSVCALHIVETYTSTFYADNCYAISAFRNFMISVDVTYDSLLYLTIYILL